MALDLYQLAALAEIFGAGGIVFALIFGAVQVQHLRRERADRSAAELMHVFQSAEFFQGFKAVVALPEGATAEQIRAKGPAFESDVNRIAFLLEELGVLVFRRVIPITLVNETMGGFLRIAWTRMKPWIVEERARLGAPTFGEWFQWIAERLDETPALKKEPAHLRYRNWRA